MTDLNRKPPVSDIDPGRFTGKTFTTRKCFPDSKDDYSIVIDGLRAGRIIKKVRPSQRVVWAWFFHGPYYPHGHPHNGEEETLDALKKLFWQWQAWALQQPGKAPSTFRCFEES